jgi:hypothetical protein
LFILPDLFEPWKQQNRQNQFCSNRSNKPVKPIGLSNFLWFIDSVQIFCQFELCTSFQLFLSGFDKTDKTDPVRFSGLCRFFQSLSGRWLDQAASMVRAGIQLGTWQLRPLWRGGWVTMGGWRCGGNGRVTHFPRPLRIGVGCTSLATPLKSGSKLRVSSRCDLQAGSYFCDWPQTRGGGVEMLLSYQPKTIVTGFNKNSKNQKIGQFLYKIYFLKFGEK